MLKPTKNFVLANRESIDNHDRNLKKIEQSLKLKETRMGEYHRDLILSLTSLPESPHHYGRPPKVKRPFVLKPQTKYNDTFFKAIVPLEKESENRAIVVWIYKEETIVNLTK